MSALLLVLAASAAQPLTGIVDVGVTDGAGSPPACATDAGGDVHCWGAENLADDPDASPDLAERDRVARQGARPWPFLRGVRQFARGGGGEGSMCGLVDGGRVRCLRRGGTVSDIGVQGAVELALGDGVACARLGDGTVTCWGAAAGCGAGVRPDAPGCASKVLLPPRRVDGVTGAVAISMSLRGGCALDRAGRLTCWGEHPFGGTDPSARAIEGVPPLAALALGPVHVAAIGVDGVALFGRRDGARPLALAPVPGARRLGALARVATGPDLTVWLRADGRALLAGPGFGRGARRPGQPDEAPPRLLAGLDDAVGVAIARSFACFVTRGGRVRCIGSNAIGELASGTVEPVPEGPPSTVSTFEVAPLPPREACAAAPGAREACLRAGPRCTLAPPPDDRASSPCSGVGRRPDRSGPPPACLCTCSAAYNAAVDARTERIKRCGLVPSRAQGGGAPEMGGE